MLTASISWTPTPTRNGASSSPSSTASSENIQLRQKHVIARLDVISEGDQASEISFGYHVAPTLGAPRPKHSSEPGSRQPRTVSQEPDVSLTGSGISAMRDPQTSALLTGTASATQKISMATGSLGGETVHAGSGSMSHSSIASDQSESS